jgi:hypothetical protein
MVHWPLAPISLMLAHISSPGVMGIVVIGVAGAGRISHQAK